MAKESPKDAAFRFSFSVQCHEHINPFLDTRGATTASINKTQSMFMV